ncbi:MAG: ABC transporter permease [Planctomycetia bacterium]|nr:ABC transporter permease [Planctomycetia bacterium]
MNWQQLTALLWLRWRLMANQWRRAGTLNAVLMTIAAVGVVVLAVPLFIASIAAGVYLAPKAQPAQLMYVWDGVVIGFVFFWLIGLITELQRTEPLSLMKFLHLPVSVNGAFLINYISSFARISLILFFPVMLGLTLALIYARGAMLLFTAPLVAAFLLMITALTYQFQGWLASLMSNPRRRRTVVVVATGVFILITQVPNLMNYFGFWGIQNRAKLSKIRVEEYANLELARAAGEFGPEEQVRRQKELSQKYEESVRQADRETAQRAERTALLLNQSLPIGWLPLGVMSAAEGRPFPALLGCLGMTLIGSASLWRAYRTTVGLYQGEFSRGKSRKKPAVAVAPTPAVVRKPGELSLLERQIPGVSEPVAVIALGTLRSLLRSPEAKMMLLTLVIMSLIFGGLLFQIPARSSVWLRPLTAIGAMFVVLFGILQMMSNLFGFDRDGFRVFVLSAASRRDILLGKNLAFAPITLGTALIALVVVQIASPMRFDHLLAILPLYLSMYLMFCMLANLISIYAPMHIALGSLKPANPKLKTVVLQLVLFMFLFPLTQGPVLLPLGIEALLTHLGWPERLPVFLVLSLAECAVVVWLYRAVLDWQGDLLQEREQRILETVTGRAL